MRLHKCEHQIASAVAVAAVATVAIVVIVVVALALTDAFPPHLRRRSTSCQAGGIDIAPAAAAGSSPEDGGGVGTTRTLRH